MCRLYGFRASEATKVECTLVHAQNALMVQSKQDMGGYSHSHGWGLATYENHLPRRERQAWAAYHGEHFKSAAAKIFAPLVLAHVRRATVGPPAVENTHPFIAGSWSFVHNGTVPNFDAIRPRMLAETATKHRAAVEGVTDSEHVFRFLLSRLETTRGTQFFEGFREAINQVRSWSSEAAPKHQLGLNVLLTDGTRFVGTRIGRTLYAVERDRILDCEICGFPHVHHDPRQAYRAVVIASEPISHEAWQEVRENAVFEVTAECRLHVTPL